ncbi:MAG: site-specific integrase [Phycisphaerales bacterium]|nr:site-specific integrase [Phycisphaerales bacterium]
MATLYRHGDSFKIQFIDRDGERRTITLGPVTVKDAAAMQAHIERLIDASIGGGSPPRETAAWLAASVGNVLHERIARVGLCEPRRLAALRPFADDYERTRTDWSAGTRQQFRMAIFDAVSHFGADRRLATITPADADAFVAFLRTRSLAVETAKKRAKIVKHLFAVAVRSHILGSNPFAHVKTGARGNPERMRYIDRVTAEAVAAELTGEVRLTFMLGRWAGLRLPSEANALRWQDVDFHSATMRVFALKTRRSRTVPIVPQLFDELLTAHERSPEGAERVIANPRRLPVLQRAIERAIDRVPGLARWPRITQNLRSSFATDLVRLAPASVAAQVLGHSAKTAAEHYWQVNGDDFAALHKALQQAAELTRTDAHGKIDDVRKPRKFTNETALERMGATLESGQAGFEPALGGF